MPTLPLTLLSLLCATAACQALEPTTPPTTKPAAMQTALAITHAKNVWTATITWTNPTDHDLSLGRYTSFALIRTDVNPAITLAASPAGTLSPHFRVLLPAHASSTSTVTLYDASLPSGQYHVSITFPHDILPTPLETDFTVPPPTPPTTAPAAP
jgi:hypothetical protein